MRRAIAFLLFLAATLCFANDRVKIRIDTSEADAVLAILAKQKAAQPLTDADWQKLFSTEPYIRLKQREASFKRTFTDDDFRKFVTSPELAARADALQRTLTEWKKADLDAVSGKMLAYLPAGARIDATVYPAIKPRPNSFVWELETNPAIFMYLDETKSKAQFENTMAHELHHVGINTLQAAYEAKLAQLPKPAQQAALWMGAFSEGMAMLAAAGAPDIHPHQSSSARDRERWDRDMARFDEDLRSVEAFLTDVAAGKLSKEETNQRAMSFFGETQGAWYTVGYRMAREVELKYGHAALLTCMEDPRILLATWNEIAATSGGTRPATWSAELLKTVGAQPIKQ